jgi:FHA domain
MRSIPLERNRPIEVSAHLRAADVGGIRVLGSARVILFDKIVYKIFLKQKFRIGRNPKWEVHLKDPTVSSEHCAITRMKPRGFLLRDSSSKNGVYVYHPLDGGDTWRRVSTGSPDRRVPYPAGQRSPDRHRSSRLLPLARRALQRVLSGSALLLRHTACCRACDRSAAQKAGARRQGVAAMSIAAHPIRLDSSARAFRCSGSRRAAGRSLRLASLALDRRFGTSGSAGVATRDVTLVRYVRALAARDFAGIRREIDRPPPFLTLVDQFLSGRTTVHALLRDS